MQDLRKLNFIPHTWPANLEKWIGLFKEEAEKEEIVNNVDDGDSETDENEEGDEDKKEDEEEPVNDVKIPLSQLMDVRTYKDIPNLDKHPKWLQNLVKEYSDIFSNDENVCQVMNVEPVELAVKPGVAPPQQHMTASLPPVHLRKSADRLLKNMLRRGLIKKADRHTGPVSRAFFKAKRNGEARLLVDYKASQVNDMLLKNFHPQFGVEQLISQIPPGMKYYFSSDVADAFFCYPLKEGKNGSDLTTFLTHTGKYSFLVSPQGLCTSQFTLGETMSNLMDTPELNIKNDGDDQDGGNTVLVDDVAGWARSEEKVKRMLKDFFSRCRLFNVRLNAKKFQ